MKKMARTCLITFPLFVIVLFATCSRGDGSGRRSALTKVSSSDTAKISFKEYEHDFGRITAGEKVAYIFTFENTGTAPLVITSVTTSCGCTISKYDKKPVSRGKSGNIEVVFDSSGRNGIQTKSIIVNSNANKAVVLLKISCEIISSTNN